MNWEVVADCLGMDTCVRVIASPTLLSGIMARPDFHDKKGIVEDLGKDWIYRWVQAQYKGFVLIRCFDHHGLYVPFSHWRDFLEIIE